MPILLFIFFLLSCNNATLLCADRNHWLYQRSKKTIERSDTITSLTTPSVPSCPLTQLATPALLDLDTEITPLMAHSCFKHHESELGKTPEELNTQLRHILIQPRKTIGERFRSKLIALLFAGAQEEKKGGNNRLLTYTISTDDIQLAHYLFENQLTSLPNECYNEKPILWHCASIAMAQLLLKHDADVSARDRFGGNILHHLSGSLSRKSPAFALLYHTRCPGLLDATDDIGETPLAFLCSDQYLCSNLHCAYTLLNFGADTTMVPTDGPFAGATLPEILRRNSVSTFHSQQDKQDIRGLADYIQNISKIRGSLFGQLWDQWHNNLDDEATAHTTI